jgi:hypothetical protein
MVEYTLKINKISTPTDPNWATTIPTEYTNIKGRVYNIVKVENGGKTKYDKNGYWQANADLMGLINPFTNPISNKLVTETKIELVYKDIHGWEEESSEKMYFDFLATMCVKKMQERYKELYGVDIDISYIKSVEEKKVDDIPPTELSLKYILYVDANASSNTTGVTKVTFEIYENVNGNVTLLSKVKDFTTFKIDNNNKISVLLSDIDNYVIGSIMDGSILLDKGGNNKLVEWLDKNKDKLPKDTKYVLDGYPVEEKKDIKTETKTAEQIELDAVAWEFPPLVVQGEFTFDVQEENHFNGVSFPFLKLEIIGVGEIKETKIDETVDETVDETIDDEIDEEYLEEEYVGGPEMEIVLESRFESIEISSARQAKEVATDNTPDSTPENYDPNSFVGAAWKNFNIDAVIKALEGDTVGKKYKATTFKESLKKILSYIKNDPKLTDVREAAYILGTGFGESGYSLQRWESDFSCNSYGVKYPASGPCAAATSYYAQTKVPKPPKPTSWTKINYYTLGLDARGWPYFGRGLIQLTGEGNYKDIGNTINIDLVGSPDKAIENETSYKIAFAYMNKNSTFKWVKKDKMVKARKSVNAAGLSEPEITGAYKAWLKAFKDVGAIS